MASLNFDLVVVTRQLAVMFGAGVHVVSSLEVLALQNAGTPLGTALKDVTRRVSSGFRLSQCAATHPRLFGPVYVRMLEVGERTGGLRNSLAHLADWLEDDLQLRRRIISALTYPAFMLALTVALTLVMFWVVLPSFFELLSGLSVRLPLPTTALMAACDALRNPVCLVLGALLTWGSWEVLRRYRATPEGELRLFRGLIATPLLGPILWHGTLARYAGVARTLLEAGVDLGGSLGLAAEASGNPVLREDAPHLVESVLEGDTVGGWMLEHPDVYSRCLAQLVRTGEESARLGRMFGRAHDFHQAELAFAIEFASSALEPLVLGLVAAMMAGVMLAVFLPLYSYLAVLSG